MTGMARISRTEVTSVIHTNTGMRIRRMPGARRLRIVTMKLDRGDERRDAEHLQPDDPEVAGGGRANTAGIVRFA